MTHQNVFIDPSPVTPQQLSPEEMSRFVGGGFPTMVIVTCGAGLGKYTVVTVGTAVLTVVD
jgi:hypothetical protein